MIVLLKFSHHSTFPAFHFADSQFLHQQQVTHCKNSSCKIYNREIVLKMTEYPTYPGYIILLSQCAGDPGLQVLTAQLSGSSLVEPFSAQPEVSEQHRSLS